MKALTESTLLPLSMALSVSVFIATGAWWASGVEAKSLMQEAEIQELKNDYRAHAEKIEAKLEKIQETIERIDKRTR